MGAVSEVAPPDGEPGMASRRRARRIAACVDRAPGSSVASQGVRPRPTASATVSNSVDRYSKGRIFSSTPRAKAPVAWGLATPLAPGIFAITAARVTLSIRTT
jgi:hypothetical protein